MSDVLASVRNNPKKANGGRKNKTNKEEKTKCFSCLFVWRAGGSFCRGRRLASVMTGACWGGVVVGGFKQGEEGNCRNSKQRD